MNNMNIQQFLDTSLTSFHATANAVEMLEQAGFLCLDNVSNWKDSVKLGGKYYATKNDSALIAFVVGKKEYTYKICVSHTDSPCLKVKGDKTIVANGVTRLNVEKYGGSICYSFFDKKLKVAGRYFFEKSGKVESSLYQSPFNVIVPSLAIHHNPTVNDGFSVNAQTDLPPVLCEGEQPSLFKIVSKENILHADLFVVPAENSFLAGINNEFLCSPRLDNLTSVFASLQGLLDCDASGLSICYLADNEEIGSRTSSGAGGSFLLHTLQRLNEALGFGFNEFASACEKGMALSIDNGHAVHPAHPEKSDVQNRVFLNGGVVIKNHPNYATDGKSAAAVKHLLNKHGVPHQDYYNKSDIRCGSTVGCILAAELAMSVCDIGLAQLAMHSATETVGVLDLERMKNCVKAFLS